MKKVRKDKGKKRGPYKRRRAITKGAAAGLALGGTLIALNELRLRRKNKPPVPNLPVGSTPTTLSSRLSLRQRRKQYLEDSGLSFDDLAKTTREARKGSKSAQKTLRSVGKRTKRIRELGRV